MGPRPDAAGHGGHCLPVPGALRFPFLMPGGTPGLWFPPCSWRGLRGERGERVGPTKESSSVGVLLGMFHTDIKSTLLLSSFLRCHTPVSWICATTEWPGHCSSTLVGGGRGASSRVTGASSDTPPAPTPPPPTSRLRGLSKSHDSCTCLSSVRCR